MQKSPISQNDIVNNPNAYLRYLIEKKCEELSEERTEYKIRLEHEIEIIFNLNLSKFFLVAWEFMTWAKENCCFGKTEELIEFGPGRDSICGSLVAYFLGITRVDPVKYNLCFELFLNVEKSDKNYRPQIIFDVDFKRKDDFIIHLKDLYGDGNIEVDSAHKMFTFEMNEGFKFKFLNFEPLVFFQHIRKIINEKRNNDEEWLEIENIPIDDNKTFELFSRGETDGVFQFEDSYMQEWLKQLKPTSLEDLVLINVLVRQTTTQSYIPKLIECKNNPEKIRYLDSCLEEILTETYGVIVYQEQILQIINKISGISLCRADTIRRCILEENFEKINAVKEEFIEGAKVNGLSEQQAEKIFENIAVFTKTAFRKAHAVPYTIVAYQMAWLKCHYPHEFSIASENLKNTISLS